MENKITELSIVRLKGSYFPNMLVTNIVYHNDNLQLETYAHCLWLDAKYHTVTEKFNIKYLDLIDENTNTATPLYS